MRAIRSQDWHPAPAPAAIFSHIPKTGGTSVLHWLKTELPMWTYRSRAHVPSKPPPQSRYVLYTGHLPFDCLVLDGLFSRNALREVFSFAFVRHPLDRAMSVFYQHLSSKKENVAHDFDTFIEQAWKHSGDTHWATPALRLMLKPASYWVFPDSGLAISQVYRLEDFNSSVDHLRRQLQISGAPHLENLSRVRAEDKPTPSERAVAIVHDLYREDFKNFDYPERPVSGND